MVLEWIKDELKSRGLAQKALAQAIGMDEDALSRTLRNRRHLKSTEEHAIREFFNSQAPSTENATGRNVGYLSVIGEIAAGAFKDMHYYDFAEYEIPYAPDPRWPRDAVRALLVKGESINRQARDGDHVVVLCASHAPRSYQAGDWVIAERTEGGRVETTVKRVRGSEAKGWELWPDSDDERFQSPIILSRDGKDGVVVTGFVLEFLRQGTRF